MNRTKLKALAHYVISKSNPSRLGPVLLNKILWYADIMSFRATGESISGETYIRRALGPEPKHILTTLGDLENENSIVIRKREFFSCKMTEYYSMSEPDLSVLSAQEISLVESLRAHICERFTANEISDISHDQVWEAANIGEEIPMVATLAASPGEMTPEVHAWADAAITRYEDSIHDSVNPSDSLYEENQRLRRLVETLIENDPYDSIADGGIVMLDQWRKDALSILGVDELDNAVVELDEHLVAYGPVNPDESFYDIVDFGRKNDLPTSVIIERLEATGFFPPVSSQEVFDEAIRVSKEALGHASGIFDVVRLISELQRRNLLVSDLPEEKPLNVSALDALKVLRAFEARGLDDSTRESDMLHAIKDALGDRVKITL